MRNDLFLADLKNGVCRSSSAVGLEMVREEILKLFRKDKPF